MKQCIKCKQNKLEDSFPKNAQYKHGRINTCNRCINDRRNISRRKTDYDTAEYENENWKDIEGFEGYYQVSNFGRVRGLDRSIQSTQNNGCTVKRRGKILNRKKACGSGYIIHSLTKDNKSYYRKPHRLVAEAFLPNPDNLPQVNHKDGNKINNRLENLEWCTAKYNTNHAVISGLKIAKRGVENKRCRFTKEDIVNIKQMAIDHRRKDISDKFNVNIRLIYKVLANGYST